MPPETDRTPDYLVERLAAGDLSGPEAHAVRSRLEAEPGGPGRVEALAAEDAATLQRLPPQAVAAEVRRRAGRARPRRTAWRLAPALALAAGVLVALPLLRPGPAPEAERVKGSAPHLVLHRSTASGAELLGRVATGRAGDLVQLGYVAAGAPYGAIVSIDGAGTVTLHWPAAGVEAAPLSSGREVLLPESFRLDDAPGYERFFLVTADRRFRVAEVVSAALALAEDPEAGTAPLPVAPDLAQSSALLVKEHP